MNKYKVNEQELKEILTWRGTDKHFSEAFDSLLDELREMANPDGSMTTIKGVQYLQDHLAGAYGVMVLLMESLVQGVGLDVLDEALQETSKSMIHKITQAKKEHDNIMGRIKDSTRVH